VYYLGTGLGNKYGDESNFELQTWRMIADFSLKEAMGGDVKNLLGGELTVFSEGVIPSNLELLIWPRAAAFASVMWSEKTDENKLAQGLLNFNEILDKQGIRHSSVTSEWCEMNMDVCFPK